MRQGTTVLIWIALFAVGMGRGAEGAVLSWFSPVGTVGGGFTPGNPVVNIDPVLDPSGSLYVWLRNDFKMQAASYNLSTTTPNVIKFTGVTVYTPDLILNGNFDFGDRWNLPVSQGTISGNQQTITNFAGVNVNQSGLDPQTRDFDQLWDSAANAALFAKISYTAIRNGSTNLVLSEGSSLIVENSVLPPLTFGTATVSVGAPVPEPSSFALGCFAVMAVRMRRGGRRLLI